MEEQLVTILMPVYNGELYLREAIDSILSQTFTNFTLLIINDGSTDSTEQIIQSYNDTRIQYVKNENNLKLISTLNKGLSLIRTKYVARMDADDISLPTRIQKQVDFLESHSDVGVLGTWCQSFGNAHNEIIKYEESHTGIVFKQLYQIQIVHPSCMIRMESLLPLEKYYDERFLHAEDYDLFTRLSHVTHLANIPEVLHLYRKHDNAVSVVYNKPQLETSIRIKQREFLLLGIDATESQIELFKQLNYQDYNNIQLTANETKALLEAMQNANGQSSYVEREYMNKKLSQLWFSYCYETKQPIRVFNSSPLHYKLPIVRYAKWIIKRFC